MYLIAPLHIIVCYTRSLIHVFFISPSLPPSLLPQVLDSSRSDWWLVASTEDSSIVGWVPANYLEKLLKVRSPSPTPEPFEDETGELQRILMK